MLSGYPVWPQCEGSESRHLEKVDAKLHKKLVGAYERARDAAQAYDADWRTAAHIIGLTPL